MYMAIAAILFSIYFLNVSMGAFGAGTFLGEIPEMLLLAASALVFVIAILGREAAAKEKTNPKTEE
jgi:hypothetical protein